MISDPDSKNAPDRCLEDAVVHLTIAVAWWLGLYLLGRSPENSIYCDEYSRVYSGRYIATHSQSRQRTEHLGKSRPKVVGVRGWLREAS